MQIELETRLLSRARIRRNIATWKTHYIAYVRRDVAHSLGVTVSVNEKVMMKSSLEELHVTETTQAAKTPRNESAKTLVFFPRNPGIFLKDHINQIQIPDKQIIGQ